MVAEKFRPFFKVVFSPFVKLAVKLNLTPFQITMFGLSLGIAAGVCIAREMYWLGLVLLISSGFLDLIDGGVARETNSITKKGSFLDSTADRITDISLIGGIIIAGLVNVWLGIIVLGSSVMTSYIRAKADALQLNLAGIGLVERGERVTFLGFLVGFHALTNLSDNYYYDHNLWFWAFALLAVLGTFTVIQRFYSVMSQPDELIENGGVMPTEEE
ncbi:MAG: CDP-alcohol phosphatidyltransferase family protein [Candidatus Heimdallarchaeota archaeon]|nr:CDP-alcohol phosphatidyltransferase family protein [Candidatus Heimdallarchaeota archaeon]MCK5048066.1 CDP-alcohol phosphatidyltransferase family protein [Candidatus Heimdallarchaeota archaeon]